MKKKKNVAVTLFENEYKIVEIVFLLKVVYIQREMWNENKLNPLEGRASVMERMIYLRLGSC